MRIPGFAMRRSIDKALLVTVGMATALGLPSGVRTLAAVQVMVVAALSISAYFILNWWAGSAADPKSLPALVAREAT